MLAAELRVKNAVMPLSRRHSSTSGNGLRRIFQNTISGLTTRATNSMQPISTASKCR
ncbi:hypothetical protein D3C75_1252740 [compost metagenome]